MARVDQAHVLIQTCLEDGIEMAAVEDKCHLGAGLFEGLDV